MIKKYDFQNSLAFYCFFLHRKLNAKIKLNQQKSNTWFSDLYRYSYHPICLFNRNNPQLWLNPTRKRSNHHPPMVRTPRPRDYFFACYIGSNLTGACPTWKNSYVGVLRIIFLAWNLLIKSVSLLILTPNPLWVHTHNIVSNFNSLKFTIHSYQYLSV